MFCYESIFMKNSKLRSIYHWECYIYCVSFNFIPREEVGILKGAGVKYLLKTGRLRQELGT